MAVIQKQGDTLTVKLSGRLDTVTSPAIAQDLQPHLEGIRHVIMDFEDLEYLSSGGLRMMLALEQEMEDRGGGIEVLHPNEYILEVFDMVGFREVVKVVLD